MPITTCSKIENGQRSQQASWLAESEFKHSRRTEAIPLSPALPSAVASVTPLTKSLSGKLHKELVSALRKDGKHQKNRHRTLAKNLEAVIETSAIAASRPTPQLPPLPAQNPVPKPTEINFPKALAALLQASTTFHKPLFRFDVCPEAAQHNIKVLQHSNFNLEKTLNPGKSCITSYGSEFKPIPLLHQLLKNHHRWPQLKDRLLNGVEFPIWQLPEDTRTKDIEAALIRGNHKSANIHHEFLADALSKEINKGWNLLILKEDAKQIPGLELSPLGVTEQIGISSSGNFVEKCRVTHDLSFPGESSGESINSRVDKEILEPCMFGHSLLRIIHYIVNLRRRHPNRRIFIRKEDYKSAYRRVHTAALTAKRAAVQLTINEVAYVLISLRLPFGGSPCPNEFCLVSDITTDCINDVLACPDWNPAKVQSTYTKKIPAAVMLDKSTPFAQAKDLSVTLPDEDQGKTDCFVDDLITVAVDLGNNLECINAAPCTVIHAMAHHTSGKTHVIRQNMISDEKNEAEGAAEEIKICLGWVLNTRKLTIALPSHKYQAWDKMVISTMDNKSTNDKHLRSLLGRLENMATVIPMAAHFFNNIRALQIKAAKQTHNVRLTSRCRDDLQLCRRFLKRAAEGISMNTITFRKPDKVYIGDASEHGLGGFATHGRAWTWHIPPELQGRAHINLLEFLTQIVCIWIDIIENRIKPQECLLGMGDSTTAMGWMRRANFRDREENNDEWMIKQQASRHLANIVMDADAVLYRQWFKGEDNAVADSLSRDCHYLSNASHEKFLQLSIPQQLPQNFRIRPIPQKVSSFLTSILQQLPVQELRLKAQKASDLAHGNLGILSYIKSDLSRKSTLTDSRDSNATYSSPPLPKHVAKVPSLDELQNIWWKEQSVPPSRMWHRPSGQTTGKIPDWTLTARPASYYKNSSKGIETRTDQKRNRKHFRWSSSVK